MCSLTKKLIIVCTILITFPLHAATPATSSSPTTHYIYASTIGTSGYAITEPGYYVLTENIPFSPGGAATAITIESNFVTLDMNHHTIYLNDGSATCRGIEIDPSLHNITIKNGKLSGFTGYGLISDASSTGKGIFNIKIENLDITNASCNSAVYIEGNSTNGDAHDILFSGCTITEIAATSITFYMVQANNITVINSKINNNTPTGTHVACTPATNCRFINCEISNNSSTNAANMLNTGQHGAVVDNCIISGNTGLNTLRGIVISGTSIIKNCIVSGNSTVGLLHNILLASNLRGGHVENCIVADNESTTNHAYGIYIDNSANLYFGTIVKDCEVQNITAIGTSGDDAFGIRLDHADRCLVENCMVLSVTGWDIGDGIRVNDTSEFAVIRNCEFYANKTGFYNNDPTTIIYGCIVGNSTTNYAGGTPPTTGNNNVTNIARLGANTQVEKFANVAIPS